MNATELQVNVEHVRPPVPVRSYDYRATLEGYEPGDRMGYGATREEAIRDLLDKLAEVA